MRIVYNQASLHTHAQNTKYKSKHTHKHTHALTLSLFLHENLF